MSEAGGQAGRIAMKNPVAEIDGDEMTRVLWALVKERLLLPFVDLKTEYYDLALTRRDETRDGVTFEAVEAVRRLGVGVKCATRLTKSSTTSSSTCAGLRVTATRGVSSRRGRR